VAGKVDRDTGDPELGAAILAAREAREWTQPDLARATGIGQTTLSNYEIGKRAVRSQQLRTIAKALNTSTDTLLGLTPPTDPQFVALADEWGHLSAAQKREMVGLARIMHAENDEASKVLDLSGLDAAEREWVMQSPPDARPFVADTMRRLRVTGVVADSQKPRNASQRPPRRANQGRA
jgi:transcriptional regulator with XRE-family HTH domain